MADIRTKLVADISDFTRKMSKAETKATSTTSSMKKSFSTAAKGMSVLAIGIAGVGAAYAGLQAAAEAAANSTQAMTTQLSATTSRLGIDTDAFVEKLNKASYGLVDNLTLMRESNRALLRELSESQVVRLMEAATVSSEKLGISLQEAYWRLTSGVAKRERELLDELVTIEHLDVMYARYGDTIGKTADELSEFEKSEALVQAIHSKTVIEGEKVIINFQKIKTAAADARNVWNSIKDIGLNTLERMLEFGSVFGKMWDGISGSIKNTFSKIEAFKGMPESVSFDPTTGMAIEPVTETNVATAKKVEKENITEIKARTAFNKKIAEKRKEWAAELAEIDKRGAEEKLAALEYEMDQEIKLYGKTAKDKQTIERIFQDQMNTIREEEQAKLDATAEREAARLAREAEREIEAAEARAERIEEGMSKIRELTLSDQEQEIADLYEHFETVWSLMDLNDERRLESVRIYQERKAAIEAEYREKEGKDYSTFTGSIVAAQKTADKEGEKSAANRFGVISGLAQAAMQQGGEMGEKAFRLNQGLEIANTIVNTSSAVMKIWAQGGIFAGPMAAAVAAIGALQVATIASASPGGSSSSSTSTSATMSTSSTNFNTADGITATSTTEEETTGSFTINIMGDIMNEDYVDLMAEKISDAVQDRNVTLKASQARTVQN